MKSLFVLILLFGGSFKVIEVTADSKSQDICVSCVEELMDQAWGDMKKASEASYQALGAFITSLSVDENGTLSLSNPAALSQLKSAAIDFDKAKKTLEASHKEYERYTEIRNESYKKQGDSSYSEEKEIDNALKDAPAREKAAYKRAFRALEKAKQALRRSEKKAHQANNTWHNYLQTYYESENKVHEARLKFHDSEFELNEGTTSAASVENAKKALKKVQAQSKAHRMSAARAQLRWGDLHANEEQSRKSWGSAVKEYTKALKALPAEVQKAITSVFFIDSSETGYYW